MQPTPVFLLRKSHGQRPAWAVSLGKTPEHFRVGAAPGPGPTQKRDSPQSSPALSRCPAPPAAFLLSVLLTAQPLSSFSTWFAIFNPLCIISTSWEMTENRSQISGKGADRSSALPKAAAAPLCWEKRLTNLRLAFTIFSDWPLACLLSSEPCILLYRFL